MAVLRGQTIAVERSKERLKNLRKRRDELIATDAADQRMLTRFLDEAGGVELSELGLAFSCVDTVRKSRFADRVIRFLADSDWNRQDSAARILGSMRAEKATLALRNVIFQPDGDSLARLSALHALSQLGALHLGEIAMLRLDPSALIREEADRLLANHKGPRMSLSHLIKLDGHPISVFDNSINRNILLNLGSSARSQPVRELADQVGASPQAIRRHLALLQCRAANGDPGQSCTSPLVTSHKSGQTTYFLLTKSGRNLTGSVSRKYSIFLKKGLSNVPGDNLL